MPRVPLLGRAGRTLRVRTRVHNLSNRAFPAHTASGRRLIRLGAQLCDADGALIDRDFARAWLPDNLPPGEQANVAIEIPVPPQRGRYALKFDLVCEGIDWFERCGSETTIKPLGRTAQPAMRAVLNGQKVFDLPHHMRPAIFLLDVGEPLPTEPARLVRMVSRYVSDAANSPA